jgi:hypothetical protein
MLIKIGEAAPQTRTKHISTLLRKTFVEQWRETALVHLTRAEIKPTLQLGSRYCAIRRRELLLRDKVGDVLDNRCSFREQSSMVQQ